MPGVYPARSLELTITIDDDQLDEVRRLVAAGQVATVSGFVRRAVEVALHDAAGWQLLLDGALQQSGGPLSRKERAWADALLSRQPRRRGGRRTAAA